MRNYKITVAGTGYVGLSIATLLSQHHQVTAVDIVPEKVELINNRKSPIAFSVPIIIVFEICITKISTFLILCDLFLSSRYSISV